MTPCSGSNTSPFPVNSKIFVSSATNSTACDYDFGRNRTRVRILWENVIEFEEIIFEPVNVM